MKQLLSKSLVLVLCVYLITMMLLTTLDLSFLAYTGKHLLSAGQFMILIGLTLFSLIGIAVLETGDEI